MTTRSRCGGNSEPTSCDCWVSFHIPSCSMWTASDRSCFVTAPRDDEEMVLVDTAWRSGPRSSPTCQLRFRQWSAVTRTCGSYARSTGGW